MNATGYRYCLIGSFCFAFLLHNAIADNDDRSAQTDCENSKLLLAGSYYQCLMEAGAMRSVLDQWPSQESIAACDLPFTIRFQELQEEAAQQGAECQTPGGVTGTRDFLKTQAGFTGNKILGLPLGTIPYPPYHWLVTNPGGTTLEKSIGIKKSASDSTYKNLQYQPGWPLLVRQDIATAQFGRNLRRESLLSFVHFTDMHITDTQSPERNPFARKFGVPYRTDFRNQEALTLQVADAMVQRVRTLSGGAATGKTFSFLISTGDNGDGRQMNELRNYINLLDGGFVNVDTSGQGYIGVQDSFFLPDYPDIYDQYYHPDPPPPGAEADKFKREYDFPEYPGLLQAATINFQATGSNLPWYSTHGNHDGTVVGFFRALAPQLALYWDQIATGNIPDLGSVMFLDLPAGMTVEEFEDCLAAPTVECVFSIYQNRVTREIPANEDRAQYLTAKFLDMHFDSPAVPGPVGHGFTEQNKEDNTLYYTFDMSDEIVGIVLDTVDISGGAGGSIGTNQAQWFEQQLQQYSGRYLDTDSEIVTTGNANKLIVIFSHHNLMTIDNSASLPGDPDPVKLLAQDIEDIVLRYPNVILWVNGHSHVNRIWSHRSFNADAFLIPAFWEVNTASHIDYPQQARSIEIVDNNDGTLSIFAIIIDHLAPPEPDPANLDILSMASISREISINDPDFNIEFQLGDTADLNVELIINKPF